MDSTERLPRRLVTLALLVGVLLHLPGLATGYFADDFTHQWILAGESYGDRLAPWALFDFGAASDYRAAEELGGIPWWTAEDWKVRFFRPVASVQMWLEDRVVGGAALGHGIGGLLLWAVLLGAVARLGQRLGLAPGAIAIALVIFACDESTHLPVTWTANRNSLLEALLGVLAVTAVAGSQVRARDGLTATALAVLATASKESGVLFLGLVFLRCATAGAASRRVAALPLAAIGGFFALWLAGGYGSTSLFYPLPWEQAQVVQSRATMLALLGLGGLLGPGALDLAFLQGGRDLGPLIPRWWDSLPAVAALSLAALAVAALPARRVRLGGGLLLWLLLGLAAQSSAPLSERLLFVPMIPFALLAGALVQRAWTSAATRPVSVLVVALAVVVSGSATVLRQVAVALAAAEARDVVEQLAELEPAGGEVIVISLPNALAGLSLGPAVRMAGGGPSTRVWPLRFGRGGATIERAADGTVRLTATEGGWLSNPLERVFASFARRPGTEPPSEHRVGPLTVRPAGSASTETPRDAIEAFESIAVTVAGGPDRATWVAWIDGGFQVVELPDVGGSRAVPAATSRAPLAP